MFLADLGCPGEVTGGTFNGGMIRVAHFSSQKRQSLVQNFTRVCCFHCPVRMSRTATA